MDLRSKRFAILAPAAEQSHDRKAAASRVGWASGHAAFPIDHEEDRIHEIEACPRNSGEQKTEQLYAKRSTPYAHNSQGSRISPNENPLE